MKIVVAFIIVLLALTGCKDKDVVQGTIKLTASESCDIRLFDSQGRQVARGAYELEKEPVTFEMKSTGLFVILAKTTDGKEKREPLPLPGGEIEHHIKF